MASLRCRPLLLFLILFFVSESECQDEDSCKIKLEAFKPKGFRVTADAPGVTGFTFEARINRDRFAHRGKDVTFEVTEPSHGKWIGEDPNLVIQPESIIDYEFTLLYNGTSCADSKAYFVRDFLDRASDWNARESGKTTRCAYSMTKVWGSTVTCSGETIFEENFNNHREDLWQIEEYVPIKDPEHPFVSYQSRTVSISDGHLHIKPELLENNITGYTADEIISGSIRLYGCTGDSDTCTYQASGPLILPPVISGRITSRGFAFTYGTVHVRAKLPQGDWIYPEILLEPLLKKYGMEDYASGIIKIACARGNEYLNEYIEDLSIRQLFGGPIMNKKCRSLLMKGRYHQEDRGKWSDGFHVYSMKWTPESISLSVDGKEYMEVTIPYFKKFPDVCQVSDHHTVSLTVPNPSPAWPFDQHFYITLGVAVGGTDEFPDNIGNKPWRNRDTKAMLNFWRDQDNWYKTWKQPELLVDYVKVVAL